MRRFRVTLLGRAKTQIREIAAWWRANRGERHRLPLEELRAAIGALGTFPDIGIAHPTRARHGVRRVLLPRSQYWVYYVVNEELGEVAVLAVWRASRGKGPPLR
jgi:plasmid stabilization system protein ParE